MTPADFVRACANVIEQHPDQAGYYVAQELHGETTMQAPTGSLLYLPAGMSVDDWLTTRNAARRQDGQT